MAILDEKLMREKEYTYVNSTVRLTDAAMMVVML